MKIKPLFDKILIQVIETEDKTKSGIILPSAAKEKQQIAKVIAVGPGGMVDGQQVKMQIKVGDKIIYPQYSGVNFKVDSKEYIIISQSDVLAIVE